MTVARKTIINVSETPYYHCMGRCVRRAFLCGEDPLTGKDFSHRKQWIVDKLAELSDVFMIDVCAYAVMSNHYHLVLKIKQEQCLQLSDEMVIQRWLMLFGGNVLISRFVKGECHSQGEIDKVNETIALWRSRLSDISWFMRCLNESIAHMANKEDQCSGRFWEGRFKSQALLNEQAVLSCMVYVDLNPVRAGVSGSLDDSEFTSIEQRIKSCDKSLELSAKKKEQNQEQTSVKLADFVGGKEVEGIPYTFMDYLELADWTGRAVREDKTGFISDNEPKIINKLGIDSEIWLDTVNDYSEGYHAFVGSEAQLKTICENTGRKWLSGMKVSRLLYYSG